MNNLWVIIPVYNEQDCIARVVEEWVPVLKNATPHYTLCLINDGSRDETLPVLHKLATQYPEIRVVDKSNSGHGQTCLHGYRMALQEGADWVLQIDSDGQCDASYFSRFWETKNTHPVVYGFRFPREDGMSRFIISRLVSVATLFGIGIWVKDPGVPYRLMHKDTLKDILPQIPDDFYLVNIVLAALQQKSSGIRWITIRFRQRIGGTPKINGWAFVRQGGRLFKQLVHLKSMLPRP